MMSLWYRHSACCSLLLEPWAPNAMFIEMSCQMYQGDRGSEVYNTFEVTLASRSQPDVCTLRIYSADVRLWLSTVRCQRWCWQSNRCQRSRADWLIEVLSLLWCQSMSKLSVLDGDGGSLGVDGVGCQSWCPWARCPHCLWCRCSLLLPLHDVQHVREVGRDVAMCLWPDGLVVAEVDEAQTDVSCWWPGCWSSQKCSDLQDPWRWSDVVITPFCKDVACSLFEVHPPWPRWLWGHDVDWLTEEPMLPVVLNLVACPKK